MADFPIDPTPTNPEDEADQAGYDSGDNTEVTEAVVQDPVLEKFQTAEFRNKWCEELEASRKERKDFVKDGYTILERWGDKRNHTKDSSRIRSAYNAFYANTELKQGALYARTPAPDIKRRWNDPGDQVGRVASLMLTRCLEYELDEDNFDETFRCVLFDRLVPGMGVGWSRLAQDGGDLVTGQFYGQMITNEDGEEVPHPLAEQLVPSEIEHQFSHIDHVSWDDLLWSPCRTWKLCRWIGRRIPMSKQAVDDRFGKSCPEQNLDAISYENEQSTGDGSTKEVAKDFLRTKNQVESTTDVYEIWDKELKKVWWICESCDVPLDVQDDSNEFPGFFPTPLPPLGRFDGSNTIPYPDYKFAQDLYEDINDTHNRGVNMIRAAQVKGTYDAAFPELQELLTTGTEFRLVPVKNWMNIMEKGGLKGAVEMLNIQPFAEAAQLLGQAKANLIANLNDIEGINDLIKVEAATNETVLATQLKAAFGTSRLGVLQREAASYIQSLLRLKAHLICKFYTPKMITERIGTLTPEDQQLIPQALQLLKNEQLRNFKLTVSVDSIQLPSWNVEKADRTQAIQAISQILQQGLPAAQQHPQLAPLILTLVKWGVAGYKDAQYIEGEIDNQLQSLAQASQNGQQPQQQPNPAALKAQAIQQKTQADVQIAQDQEKTKRLDVMTDAQIENERVGIEKAEATTNRIKALADAHNQAKSAIHGQAIDQLDAHDQAKNSIHNQTMDRMEAKPDLTIVLPTAK